MSARPSWVDGRLVPAGEPAVRAEDQGFQHGLAVYDGMLLDKGCRIFEEQHIARLEHAARALEITWPLPISIRSALDEYVAALGEEGPLLLRTQISRGVGGVPTVVITSRDVDPWPYPGIKVTVEARAKVSSSELEQLKSTNRLRNVLAREAAVRAGAWEALLMTEEGDLTEGTVSNLFCVLDGVVLTPPVERGLLPGIVRAELLAELSVRGDGFSERQLGLAEISRASEVFLTNTSGRLIPVVNVIGVNEELPGALGARWGELSQIFREREERDMDASRSGSS
jgi:branched-subunit amino acid aminotransferase/4-amino-4-deoxychorismate lyase